MANVNVVSLSGHLGDEPVFRVSANGSQLITFDLAVNERVRDSKGEWTSRANWFKCVRFGKSAEWLDKVLHRGSHVFVCGRLRQESYEHEGQSRRAVSVICDRVDVMDACTANQSPGRPDADVPAQGQATSAYAGDDIPF